MQFDFRRLETQERYKLLVSLIIPRPIALVTTIDKVGINNAAPFSFFNVMAEDPPLLVLGIGGQQVGSGDLKDTVRNIRDTGEFVVNLVDEPLLEKMNVCAIDFPPNVDELQEAELTPVPSAQVTPVRIAESPVQLECRELVSLNLGHKWRTVILGEIVHLHVREGLVDPATLRVNVRDLQIIGRLHGGGWYLRTRDWVQLPRASIETWKTQKGNFSQ